MGPRHTRRALRRATNKFRNFCMLRESVRWLCLPVRRSGLAASERPRGYDKFRVLSPKKSISANPPSLICKPFSVIVVVCFTPCSSATASSYSCCVMMPLFSRSRSVRCLSPPTRPGSPDHRARSYRSYSPYSSGCWGRWNRPPRPTLNVFQTRILKASSKLQADIQVLGPVEGGLITLKSNPMGIIQGRSCFLHCT